MQIEGVPDSITREQFVEWLAQVGIDASLIRCDDEVPGVVVTRGAIMCDVYALNEKGKPYVAGPDYDVAVHKVCIRVTDESLIVSSPPVLSRAKSA